ncbi:MAG: hypothetical protein MI717_00880, partial [Spirochaetales bacterium]|nr:hypothetical protein [Spirochaetales bacterium]
VGFIPSPGSVFADTSSLTQKQKQVLWAGAQADRIGDQARLGRSVVADILATYNTQVTKELYALVRSVDFNLARIEADMQGKTPNLGQGETRVQEQFKALYRVVEGFNWSDTHLAGRKTGWLSQLAVTAGKEDSAYLGQRLTLFLSRAFGEQGLTDTATTAVGYLVLLAGYTGSNRTKALAVAESLLDLGDEDGSIGALVANVIAGTATTHASVKTFFRSTELEGRLGELAHALIQEGETAQATAFRTAMGDYNVVWIQGTNGQTVMLDTSVVSETWQAGSDIGSVYGAAVSASQPWKVTYTLKQGATAIDHLGNSFVLVTGNNLDTVPDDDVDIRGYGQAGAQAYGTFSHTRDQIKREVAHVTSSAPWLDKRVATLAATMVSQLDGGSVTSAGATLGQIQTLFTNNASVLAGLMDETQAYTRARLGMESIYNAVANGSADIPAAHKTLALTFLGTALDFVALSQTPSITSTRGYYADFLSRFLAGDRTGAKARFETMLSHFNLPQGDRNSFRTAMAAIIDLSGSPLDRMRALPAALEEMVLKIHLGRRAVPTFLTDLRSEAATLATQDLPRLATTQAQLSGISQSPSFGSSTQAQLTFDKVLIDHFTTPL